MSRGSLKTQIGLGLLSAWGLFWSIGVTPMPAAGQVTQQPAATSQRFVLRSQTNLVLVDVRVWDKNGMPVRDLEQQDFRILEDGAPQVITSFSLENVERLAQATAEGGPPPTIDLAKLPPNVPPAQVLRDHRLTVIFFDLTSMPADDLMRALRAARDFVQARMTPADLVAIATYASSLRIAQDFTNDRDALAKALQGIRVGEESSALSEAGSQGEAGATNAAGEEVVARDVSAAFTPDETEFNIFNTDQKLAAVESLARLLREVPGRKAVIHFSSGVESTGSENQAQLRATTDAANRSNVSLYTVDARGLVALPPGGDASSASAAGTAIYTGQATFSQISSLHGSRETLASLATDTGGRTFYDLNDFSPAFQQMQAENSSYYLLGYSPSNTRSDGRFRRIRVEVVRAGVKVAARPGYFAPKDFRQFTREDKELQLQQALELDQPFLDLPFAVDAAYFRRPDKKYYVVLAAKIPGSAVSFLKKSEIRQTEFDFVWRATDPSGKPAGLLRDTLPVKVSGETYEQVLSGNILYEGGFVLPPGKYQLKVLVRENQTGKMGTFEQPLVVPQATDTGLSLSSVVLSNEMQETALNTGGRRRKAPRDQESPLQVGGKSVLPSVTRVFRSNQNLYVLVESYGGKSADTGQSGGAAPAEPSFALAFFRGGAKVAEAGPFAGKLEKSGGDKASYFAQIPLEKFPVGRYMVQVNVLDPAAERAAFARVPMAVVKAPPPPAPAGRGE
jgi:VWFA-related protein